MTTAQQSPKGRLIMGSSLVWLSSPLGLTNQPSYRARLMMDVTRTLTSLIQRWPRSKLLCAITDAINIASAISDAINIPSAITGATNIASSISCCDSHKLLCSDVLLPINFLATAGAEITEPPVQRTAILIASDTLRNKRMSPTFVQPA